MDADEIVMHVVKRDAWAWFSTFLLNALVSA